ncbi:MAG: rRNA maturation RNase YbeY [Acidobacteriota bacterium]|nr:rRNA maturation RNase YbeY [Acidobacteriota bacterium]
MLSFPVTDETAPDAGIEAAGRAANAGNGPNGSVAAGVESLEPVGGGARHLGDIVIATGVARRQARAAGHRFGAELRCLALHGLLHLLGYDHERDTGQMERLERRLRRAGGLA